MKKLFFLLAMCLLMAACSSHLDEPQMAELPETDGQSDYLTPAEACEIASDAFDNFFKGTADATPSSRSARSAYAHFYQSDALSRSQSPSLYVVDFEEGGFAVVNAYRNASTRIYAVVEEGQFDDSDNPGLKYYMAFTEERAAAEYAKRANSIIGGGIVPIKKDKLINRRDTLIKTRSEWNRNAPYNSRCAFMPNSTERYPVSTLAMSLATLVADQRWRNREFKVESFRDGRIYYSFDWTEMLEFSTIDYLTDTGQNDICKFLEYYNTFDYRQDEKGDFISHDVVPDVVSDVMEYSHWLSKPRIYKHGAPIDTVFERLANDKIPQVMYGEQADESVGDVWLIQGARIDTYQMESPSIDGTAPGAIYEMEYLYFNWCLGGRSNGWYFYNGVWHEYYNNDESTGKDDPNVIGECYTKNILMALGSKVCLIP